MLFDWLVTGQVVATNPAHSERGPKHVVKAGKTTVLTGEQANRRSANNSRPSFWPPSWPSIVEKIIEKRLSCFISAMRRMKGLPSRCVRNVQPDQTAAPRFNGCNSAWSLSRSGRGSRAQPIDSPWTGTTERGHDWNPT